MESLEPSINEADYGDAAAEPHIFELPHDDEAERSVLGNILRNNHTLQDLEFPLKEEDFYVARHRLIFNQIKRLTDAGRAADAVTIAEALKASDKLAKAGGNEYLLDLYELGDLNTNFKDYVQLVKDKSILRKLRKNLGEIQQKVNQPGEESCQDILEGAETAMFHLADEYANRRMDVTEISDLADAINKKVTDLYERIERGESAITGVASSFNTLDFYTSGFQPSDLIILAARPSVGKTAFALDIARHICNRQDKDGNYTKAVAMFSLEMSAQQIGMRLVSSLGEIDQHQLRAGKLKNNTDWKRFSKTLATMKKWPFWVDDTVNLNLSNLRSKARRMQRACLRNDVELNLIIVDYLQLMDSEPDPKAKTTENRATEVAKISRGLKAVARELKVPVLALSQMSRKIEERTNRRPQLSDLRESGGIEQDADLIMFLSQSNTHANTEVNKNVIEVELQIGKHRNGPTGEVQFTFDKRYTSFSEVKGQDGYDPNTPGSDPDIDEDEVFSS